MRKESNHLRTGIEKDLTFLLVYFSCIYHEIGEGDTAPFISIIYQVGKLLGMERTSYIQAE